MIKLDIDYRVLQGDRPWPADKLMKPSRYFMELLPRNPNVEDFDVINRAVITYKLPLQTVGKSNIQQYLINSDTTSALISDIL